MSNYYYRSHNFMYIYWKGTIFSPIDWLQHRGGNQRNQGEDIKKKSTQKRTHIKTGNSANYCATVTSIHLSIRCQCYMTREDKRNLVGTLQQKHTHSYNMLHLGSVVGERRAVLPPDPLWRTPTPSPLMRKDRGLREAETKIDCKTIPDSRATQKLLS